MSIEFYCATCSSQLTAPDEAAGKLAKCPCCGGSEPIPEAEPEASSGDETEAGSG